MTDSLKCVVDASVGIKKFTQELGVRRQTVSEWENGAYDPDRSTTKFLELIAKQSDFQAPLSKSDRLRRHN